MKDYKILSNVSEEALAVEVRLLLKDGWLPLGGVAIAQYTLYQAMVLPQPPEKPESKQQQRR